MRPSYRATLTAFNQYFVERASNATRSVKKVPLARQRKRSAAAPCTSLLPVRANWKLTKELIMSWPNFCPLILFALIPELYRVVGYSCCSGSASGRAHGKAGVAALGKARCCLPAKQDAAASALARKGLVGEATQLRWYCRGRADRRRLRASRGRKAQRQLDRLPRRCVSPPAGRTPQRNHHRRPAAAASRPEMAFTSSRVAHGCGGAVQ